MIRALFGVVFALGALGCGTGGPHAMPEGAVVHLPCQPLSVSMAPEAGEGRRAAVAAALETWNQHGFTRFTLEGEGEPIALHIAPGKPMFRGFYDPDTGEVLISHEVEDPFVLQIVVAHELGHAMGLPHVDPKERRSVMNPGNIALAPTADDGAAVRALCSEVTPE